MSTPFAPPDSALAVWAERDHVRAIHPADHDVVRTTAAARALVLELFESPAVRDLFNACAGLGHLMAEGGASPSLTAGTIDEAIIALGAKSVVVDPTRAAAARASLLEGYVAAVRQAEHVQACSAWAYPACVVPLDGFAIAIACGHPTADAEALGDWAAQVAARAVKAKVRRAVLSGDEAAMAAVASALEFVGIEISAAGAPTPSSKARWFRLPWQK